MRGEVYEGCRYVQDTAVPFPPFILVIEMNSGGERYDPLAPGNGSPPSASSYTSTNNEAWVVTWLF